MSSRPKRKLNVMVLSSAVKWTLGQQHCFRVGCIRRKASKHDRQPRIQKCNMVPGNTHRLQGGSGKDRLTTQAGHTAPQSACRECGPAATASRSGNTHKLTAIPCWRKPIPLNVGLPELANKIQNDQLNCSSHPMTSDYFSMSQLMHGIFILIFKTIICRLSDGQMSLATLHFTWQPCLYSSAP